MTKFSVIVSVYNEEATIIQLLEAVARQNIEGVTFEIIVIDDGSRDKTVSLLQDRPEAGLLFYIPILDHQLRNTLGCPGIGKVNLFIWRLINGLPCLNLDQKRSDEK